MRFYSSDTHFGHANVIEYCARPFSSVEEMNLTLINNWNEVVSDDDEVWVLGDVAMGKIAETLPLVSRLRGEKYLIPGNHDRCWSFAKKGFDWIQRYEDVGFTVMPSTWCHMISGETVLLNHFPYTGDSHEEDRYVSQRPADEGQWLLCGHVHNAWAEREKMINVGVDVRQFRPISEDEIGQIIQKGTA